MTPDRVGGTARERGAIIAMTLIGGALPVAANLRGFHDVVWVFWLAGLTLLSGALTLAVSVIRRERHSPEP